MVWPLSAAALLVAIGGVVLFIVLRHLKLLPSPGRRRARMQEVWQRWVQMEALDGPQRAVREALLGKLSPEVRDSVRGNLLEFEGRLRAERVPLEGLRRELMDSVDRRLLNTEILELPAEVRARLRQHSPEMIQNDDEARVYIAANELRMAVLREFASMRFGDRADGDWFDVYQKASRLRQRGARNFIQRTLNGTQSSADDARYQSMTLVDHEIRKRLLKVPAGTRFQGFGAVPVTEK